MLPPLQKAPGSRRGFSRGLVPPGIGASTNDLNTGGAPTETRNPSRAGSYATSRIKSNALQERVLFPTQVKESFLQRNKHMANEKMQQMASDFAARALA